MRDDNLKDVRILCGSDDQEMKQAIGHACSIHTIFITAAFMLKIREYILSSATPPH